MLSALSIRCISVCLILSGWRFGPTWSRAEDRIWLEATINRKPVRLCFDSGSEACALSPDGARKLNLKFLSSRTNGLPRGFLPGETEECSLTLQGTEFNTSFLVLDVPPYAGADFDGLIGWPLFSRSLVRIDALNHEIQFLSKLPNRTRQWSQLTLLTNSGCLDLGLTYSSNSDDIISMDTGSYLGFELPVSEWNKWQETHPHSPITYGTTFSPRDGFRIYEEAWADQICIGPIILTGVPIEPTGPANPRRLGKQFKGTLGLAALKRLDIIIDGTKNIALLRPKTTPPPAYPHNRLGAVFVPVPGHTNEGVARVVEGSPAYEAGVRNGDVLVQVDDVLVRSWSTSWLQRFSGPAGSHVHLTLKRDGTMFETTAVLREILQSSKQRN